MLLVDEGIDDNTRADSLELPDGEPYSRAELQRVVDGLPTRGPVCPECHMHIPQFRDLSLNDEARVRDLIRRNQKIEAMRELRVYTNCPIA